MAEGNNIDPAISLGVKTPDAINPLTQAASLLPAVRTGAEISDINSQVQQRQIANAMSLRTIAAQNAAAQAGAQSIDPTTGEPDLGRYSSLLLSNPLTAAMAPQAMSFARQAQQFQLQSAQVTAKLTQDALGGMFGAIASAAGSGHPEQIGRMVEAAIAPFPEFVKQKLGPVYQHFQTALTTGMPDFDGLPADEQAKAEGAWIKQQVQPAAMQYLTKDQFDTFTGKYHEIDDGRFIHPGRVDSFTQEFSPQKTPNGTDFVAVKGAPPGFAGQDLVPRPAVGGGLTGGKSNPFALPSPSGPTNQMGGEAMGSNPLGVTSGVVSSTSPPPAASPSTPTSWATGKPFIISADPNVVPGRQTLGGQAQLRNPKLDLSDKLGADGEYTRTFQNAQVAMQQMQDLGISADRLGSKGWLSPGFAANQRATIAKMVNAFSQVTGANVGFDPLKLSSAEDIQKNSYRLGISSLTQMLGAQREAANTIEHMFTATPGMENSPLGLQLLLATVKASSQMAMDRYGFQSAWAAQNHTLSSSAETEFAKQSPPESYAVRALNDIGLGMDGWESPASLKAAVAKGWVTPSQASSMAQEQWGEFKNGK